MKILGNINVVEFSESYGNIKFEKVAIFNANMISEDDALKMIKAGEYNANVLIMDKKQWINIFCNGKDDE